LKVNLASAPGSFGSDVQGAAAIGVALNKTVQIAAIAILLAWGGSAAVADGQQPGPTSKKVLVAAHGVAVPAVDAPAKAAADKPRASKATAKKKPRPDPVPQLMSDVADWVRSAGDNRGAPFAVIDKTTAQILVYGADGKALGRAPVLIGSSVGDGSAPGIGDRELSDIPMDERTTPAGRYLVGFGPAAGHARVLWVDYVNSISIHAIPSTRTSAREKRTQRLASKIADDNRITHGCINVSPAFYRKTIATTFKKGGVFYVLPDTEALQEAIPAYGLNSVEAIAALEAAAPHATNPEDGKLASSDEGSATDTATPEQ
jgi:hypothetical protein